MNTPTKTENKFAAWRSDHKFHIQSAVLIVVIGASFGLFCALNAGLNGLGAGLFGLISAGMLVSMWIS